MKKNFTSHEVYSLLAALVLGVAFLETSSPILSVEFFKDLLTNFVKYSLISFFIIILWQSFK